MAPSGPRDRRVRLGVLYPGHAGEGDYERYADLLCRQLDVHIVNVPWGAEADGAAALRGLGSVDRLLDSAPKLRAHAPDVVVWACTSCSFLLGSDGMRDQATRLADYFGVPATSTTLAYIDALTALGATRVSIGSIYEEHIVSSFIQILEDAGVEVVELAQVPSHNRDDFLGDPELRHERDPAASFASWPLESFLSIVRACSSQEADAILIPETGFMAADIIPDLERCAGKPVLMSNQVTMWSALRLVGSSAIAQPQFGALSAM